MGKKTKPMYMLFTKEQAQNENYTQTKKKQMEKDISCNWKMFQKLEVLISGKNRL